jgi:hypothetical protein
MDPPNVLWYFGAFTLGFAVYGLIETIPTSQSGLWILLTAVGFIAAFALTAAVLLRRGWWVPGGLAAALAVAVFPAGAVAFLTLIGVWPDDPFFEPLREFSGSAFGVALATALAALAVWRLTRFSFVLAVVSSAILVAAQLLTPCFDANPGNGERAATALVAGLVLFIVGVFLDALGRRRDAFWFEVLGLLGIAAGLVYFTAAPGGDPQRGWIPMLVGGAFLLAASGLVTRASWAAYGVLGVYAAIAHYLIEGLDERRWPFALALIALAAAIVVLGMVQQRLSGRSPARTMRPRRP